MPGMIPSTLLAIALLSAPARENRLAQNPRSSRAEAVIEAVHRSGAVARCWNAYLRSTPEAPSVRFRVRIEVSADGSVRQVSVLDPAPAALTLCVRAELRRISMAAGEAVSVETTYSFAAGVPAPVPAAPTPPAGPRRSR